MDQRFSRGQSLVEFIAILFAFMALTLLIWKEGPDLRTHLHKKNRWENRYEKRAH